LDAVERRVESLTEVFHPGSLHARVVLGGFEPWTDAPAERIPLRRRFAWRVRLDAPALGSPAVANGHIYVAITSSLYAIR
jgi:PQQ-like domain